MHNIKVFYLDDYTKEHNEIMKYIINNLKGIEVLQDVGDSACLRVTDKALEVVDHLAQIDCLDWE